MAYDAEDCGFQMLNNSETVTSSYEVSDPVDDETDEDEDNSNNKSSKGPSNAGAFSALETVMESYEQQSECCPTQLLLLKRLRDLAAKKRSAWLHILHEPHSVFGYPNNRVSEQCSVPIDSDKRRSTSLVYADKPQTLDHLEDNIRRVIADIRPQMLDKVIENWTSRLDYIRAHRGNHMPEIIFRISIPLKKHPLEVDYHEYLPNPVQGNPRCAEVKPVLADIRANGKPLIASRKIPTDDVVSHVFIGSSSLFMEVHSYSHSSSLPSILGWPHAGLVSSQA
ncbi:uncharacterized protein TNCV_782911 [Trichonephila clavipes]|nr:uncharacterized protein TNCV_782911 [Trichonephila clavipes]